MCRQCSKGLGSKAEGFVSSLCSNTHSQRTPNPHVQANDTWLKQKDMHVLKYITSMLLTQHVYNTHVCVINTNEVKSANELFSTHTRSLTSLVGSKDGGRV